MQWASSTTKSGTLRVRKIAWKASSSSFSGVVYAIRIEPAADVRARAHLLIFGERRVERDHVVDPMLAQHVELILHQGDERAHDDGRALEQQRAELIGQRLAGPVAKNGKRVLACENAKDDLFLAR